MLVGEGPYSLCNYTVIRCFFFSISAAVLQRCHNRGWTSLSPLSVKQAADNGALRRRWPGPPNSAVAAVALAAGEQENEESCVMASPPAQLPPHTSSKLQLPANIPYTLLHTLSSVLFTLTPCQLLNIFFLYNNVIRFIWIPLSDFSTRIVIFF